jgi:DNA-directed RNA polymerase subunit RPC12/RpoP
MAVETLGEALDFGWRVTARCAWGKRDAMKSIRECVYSAELDLQTLVWTRGRDFPLDMLASRLRCPRCGSRRVRIALTVPPTAKEVRERRA